MNTVMPPVAADKVVFIATCAAHGTSSAIVHAQGAARVEAIPAEPQGEGAQHNQWKIVDFKTNTLPSLQDSRSDPCEVPR